MPIIMISSAAHSGGEDLAVSLAQKTGWPLLMRKELADRAAEQGIKLGRLETSIIKTPVIQERLAREKNLFLAFVTTQICEEALEGNLIYQGRAGHLLLPGVTHRLRVGLTAPMERRIPNAMHDLDISREKARAYLDGLDKDFDKWVRYVYRVDRRDQGHYDFFINLQNISLPNASAVLCSMADLPDFRPTPASLKLMDDHHIAARARLQLALDERTRNADLGVRAVGGMVTVTYMPRQEGVAKAISEVLEDLEGCRESQCTMAETNILWIQETFEPNSESFQGIMQLSQRWGAAVELLRLVPPGAPGNIPFGRAMSGDLPPSEGPKEDVYTGGVEDDEPEPPGNDGGLARTLEELVAVGRSAGGHTICGGRDEILETLTDNGNYSLVVIGDLFLSKDHQARVRQTRELGLAIRERVKAPVINAEDMQSRFLFGKRQAVKLLAFVMVVVSLYGLVFSHQGAILNFLGGEIHEKWKWLASLSVALFVPCVAYLYGTVTGLLLKLIGID